MLLMDVLVLNPTNLMTPRAFCRYVSRHCRHPSREEQRLKIYDPSDVQAEVLVFDVIEPHDIACVVFERSAARDAYAPYLGDRKLYLHANNMYGDGIHLTVAPLKGSGHTASNRITKRYPYRVIRSHRMTTNEKVARRKLSLLELAKELNNVSKACKLIGYSRQQFYEIRRNYQTYGAEGLLDKLPGCKGAHPNRVAPEIEQAILNYSPDQPMARCGSQRTGSAKASTSVRAVCVAYGNGTTVLQA